MTTSLDKVLYTAKTHATGGRDGQARSDDGRIEVKLSPPGQSGSGTNPEQLFGVGYSACFLGAMKAVAPKLKTTVPADTAIDAEVDLGPTSVGYGIAVRLNISLPGMERAAAEQLVAEAHKVCPYSNATRNNIDVKLNIA
jgi:Ohr subfamily peroxiredoxin